MKLNEKFTKLLKEEQELFLIEASIDENQWKKFFDSLLKITTKVNDKYASAYELVRAIISKAKGLFDMDSLRGKMVRPSTAVMNADLAKIITDVVNEGGATLSLVAVKTAARAA
jgi:hypothetical protein